MTISPLDYFYAIETKYSIYVENVEIYYFKYILNYIAFVEY